MSCRVIYKCRNAHGFSLSHHHQPSRALPISATTSSGTPYGIQKFPHTSLLISPYTVCTDSPFSSSFSFFPVCSPALHHLNHLIGWWDFSHLFCALLPHNPSECHRRQEMQAGKRSPIWPDSWAQVCSMRANVQLVDQATDRWC